MYQALLRVALPLSAGVCQRRAEEGNETEMTQSTTGWILFMAALGMMAGLMGAEINNMADWALVVTPAFVGKGLIHFSTVVAAFVGGKLLPGPGDRRE